LEGFYGVVQGSRRYAGALKVGMEKVPCLVEEMDDTTAIGRSLAENIHRRELSYYEVTMAIAGMWNSLLKEGYEGKEEVVKVISEKTGLSRTSVQKYLEISELEEGIIRLMQVEKDERTEAIIKKVINLDKMPPGGILEKSLDHQKAHYLSRILGGRSFEDKLRCAIHLIPKRRDEAFDFIDRVRENPDIDIAELDRPEHRPQPFPTQKPQLENVGKKLETIQREYDARKSYKEDKYIIKELKIPSNLYQELSRIHKAIHTKGMIEDTMITALKDWIESKAKQLGLMR